MLCLDSYVTTGTAAKMLGVSTPRATRLAESGAVRAIRSPHGYWLIEREDLERLAEERRALPPRGGRPRQLKIGTRVYVPDPYGPFTGTVIPSGDVTLEAGHVLVEADGEPGKRMIPVRFCKEVSA